MRRAFFCVCLICLGFCRDICAQELSFYSCNGDLSLIDSTSSDTVLLIVINNHLCSDCVTSLNNYINSNVQKQPIVFSICKTNSAVEDFKNITWLGPIIAPHSLLILKSTDNIFINGDKLVPKEEKSPYLLLYSKSQQKPLKIWHYGDIYDKKGEIKSNSF